MQNSSIDNQENGYKEESLFKKKSSLFLTSVSIGKLRELGMCYCKTINVLIDATELNQELNLYRVNGTCRLSQRKHSLLLKMRDKHPKE